MNSDRIEKKINKKQLTDKNNDFQYWQTQSPAKRLEALETIRNEYDQWKYGAEQRFQRVYQITQFK